MRSVTRLRECGYAKLTSCLVALYGKPYMQAAQSAWHLLRDRGIDALVNDSLVSMSESP